MNKVILMGRLTRDPEVRYSQGDESMAIARFSLAVDRRKNANSSEEQNTDFIRCVAFGRLGEFVEKYLNKGTKTILSGRIQTGSYTNRDGVKVYTTDVVTESIEFAESKKGVAEEDKQARGEEAVGRYATPEDGFMNIPDGIEEELPFN